MRINAKGKLGKSESPEKATSIVGGRLADLGKVVKSQNMVEYAEHMLAVEKAWLLSQIGLIEDCDDDVMDEVKPFLRYLLCFQNFPY